MSNSTNEDDEIKFKILVLGDSSVGKTTLLLKYVDGYFPTIYVATIGVEFKTKKINVDGINITLNIFDTAGQERFKGVTKNFLKGADGVIYAYDITNKNSFENIKNWINTVEETITDFKQIIIGNKKDLENERAVSTEALEKFCQKHNMEGMETSAKDDINVNEMFESIAKLIIQGRTKDEMLQKYSKTGNKQGQNLNKKEKKKKKKGFC